MWEDSSCCFHCFELEDCPHLTGKTVRQEGNKPTDFFFLKIISRDADFDSVLLMYYEGSHRFQCCLGKHSFSCAQGGMWCLVSPSYCCGQTRGITDCLLWSDMRTLGHGFSWFHTGWRAGGFVCVSLLNWSCCTGQGAAGTFQLCWSHPQLQPCPQSCLWATFLDLSAHCGSSDLRQILIVNLGSYQMTKWGGNGLNTVLRLGI